MALMMGHSTRLVAYAAHGERLGVLPDPLSFSATTPHSSDERGALSLTYSKLARRNDILTRRLTDGLEIALEEHDGTSWSEVINGRFVTVKESSDRTDKTETVTLEAPHYSWLLTKIKHAAPDESLYATDGQNEGRRQFIGVNAGIVIATLLGEYADRGGPTIARGFTTSVDSNGVVWPALNAFWVSRGEALDVTISRLADGGAVDVWWEGRTMHAAPMQAGRDRSTQVILREGLHVAAAPSEETIADLITAHTVHGGDGLLVTDVEPSAPSPWGRWEGFASDDRITTEAGAQSRNQSELATAGRLRGQYTRDLTPACPFRFGSDILAGDWITAPTHADRERVRVASLLWRMDSQGVTRSLILNDSILNAELARLRKQRLGESGSSGEGSSVHVRPDGPDKRTPAQVQGLTLATQAYLSPEGEARGMIIAQWAPVTTATTADGGGLLEVERYEIGTRPNVAGSPWTITLSSQATEVEWGNLDPNSEIVVRVRARGRYATSPGVWSAPQVITVADDTTPPPVPSDLVPSSAMGTARWDWDGLTHLSAEMPLDFYHVAVEWEGVSGGAVTRMQVLTGPGFVIASDLERGSLARARARAVDRSGNMSDWTDWVAVTVLSALDDTGLGEALDQLDQDLAGLSSDLGGLSGTIADHASKFPDIDANLSGLQGELDQLEIDLSNMGSDVEAAQTLASTADGRYTVATSNPTTANASGKAIGSVWEVRSGGTTLRRYVLTGATTWTQVKVGQDFIGNNAIGQAQIGDLAVGTAQIANAAITNAKIDNLSADKIDAGTLHADRIGAGSIATSKLAAGAVTAEKVAANAITGDKVAANAITADKLIIGTAANLVPNGAGEAGAAVGWADDSRIGFSTSDVPAGTNLRGHFYVSTAATTPGPDTAVFDVEPGRTYLFEVWLKADKAGSRMYMECRGMDGSHAVEHVAGVDGALNPGAGQYFINNVVVPNGSWYRYAKLITFNTQRVRIASTYWNHSNGTVRDARQQVAGLRVVPLMGATHIEDGVITTRHVAANSITANEISSGAVTTAKLAAGAVTTEKMTAGSIDADRISAGSYWGQVIKGAEVISAASQDAGADHIKLANNTLTVNRSVEGLMTETLKIGGAATDEISLLPGVGGSPTVTITGDGSASFQGAVEANDIAVRGQPLDELLDQRHKTLLYGSRTSSPLAQSEIGLVRMNFNNLPAGRRYRFTLQGRMVGSANQTAAVISLRRVQSGQAMYNSPVVEYNVIDERGGGGSHLTVNTTMIQEVSGYNSYLWSFRAFGTQPVRFSGRWWFLVEDIGPIAGDIGTISYGTAGGTPASSDPEPDPEPTTQRLTKTWSAQSLRVFRNGSAYTGGNELEHGTWGGIARRSQILFPAAVRTELAGATNISARVYLKNTHTWAGAGGNVRVTSNTNTGLQNTPPTSPTAALQPVKRNEGKYFTIPWATNSQSVWLGIGAGSGTDQYAKFSMDPENIILEVTYTKAV